MNKFIKTFVVGSALLPLAACATPGGGPAGISMFDPNQHVASATALDGPDFGSCFSNMAFALAMLSGETTTMQFASPTCAAVLTSLQGKQLSASLLALRPIATIWREQSSSCRKTAVTAMFPFSRRTKAM